MQNFRQLLNNSAASFNTADVLHREVAKRLYEHLEPINIEPTAILDLGCGTGNLNSFLNKRFPQATKIGVDLAEQRVKQAVNANINLVTADALQLPFADNSFDLVIANLLLHWLYDLPSWLAEMHRLLRNNGLLIFSFYGPDTLKEVGKPKGGFYDMHDVGDALVRAQFNDPILDAEHFTLEYDVYEDLLSDLNATAEAILFTLDNTSLLDFDVTYEVVYAHAWKNERPMTSKIDQDGMVRISLEQLQRNT